MPSFGMITACAQGPAGAAAAAGVGVGAFDSIGAAVGCIQLTSTTEPDPTNAAVYAERMRLYKSLYPLLKPAFHGEFGR